MTLKKNVLIAAILTIKFVFSQDTINGNLQVTGNISASKLSLLDPNNTTNWNTLWQSGFYEGFNAENAPESQSWFWGLNMNHSSNNPDYRGNGQLAIKYDHDNPTMYFRSTLTTNGSGTWAKVIHDQGLQTVKGSLLLNKPYRTTNWNSIWQSGFYEGLRAENAPESEGWFWGLNMNHSSNNPDYRGNGQLAIKYSHDNPTMYFRSTLTTNGSGTWAKVLHDQGLQTVKGSLLLNKPYRTSNWNSIWQSGFYEGLSAENAPESEGWFWGLNMNHGSNNSTYRANGQIAIKYDHNNPTMYFRSTVTTDGSGTWAKVIHSEGPKQTIQGNIALIGNLQAKEVKVTLTPTADFVFDDNYKLPKLSDIEKHIKNKKHLPEIASAKEMKKNGVNIGEFQIKLLQKIEELTLYTIQQEKTIKKLEEENNILKNDSREIQLIKQEIEKLKEKINR